MIHVRTKAAKIYICSSITKYMGKIKHIIFDLGGVIINLDIPKTIAEFNKLSGRPFETIYTQLQQTPLFDDFDKGRISEKKFFDELKRLLEGPISDEQV